MKPEKFETRPGRRLRLAAYESAQPVSRRVAFATECSS